MLAFGIGRGFWRKNVPFWVSAFETNPVLANRVEVFILQFSRFLNFCAVLRVGQSDNDNYYFICIVRLGPIEWVLKTFFVTDTTIVRRWWCAKYLFSETGQTSGVINSKVPSKSCRDRRPLCWSMTTGPARSWSKEWMNLGKWAFACWGKVRLCSVLVNLIP